MKKKLPQTDYFCSTSSDPFEEKLKDISSARQVTPRPGKITLVVPPSPQIPTPGREFLLTAPFEGLTAIATLIKKMGYDLTLVDCRLKENIEQLVLDGAKDADVVGIATFCDSFVFLQEITAALKKSFPDKTIFLGGSLVTSLPEMILNHTRADGAILGEGELTLIEFLEKFFAGKGVAWHDIKGVAYKKDGAVIINPPRPQIKNIDHLPFPDFTVWPNFKDIVKNGQILISSMRGCPHDCSFCFKTIPSLRMKSIARFEEEVAYLKKTTGVVSTWLNDLTFNAVTARAAQVCMILKKYDIRFHCFARVNKIDRDLVVTLKASGCQGIWFGIESFEQNILDSNRKRSTIDEINRAIKLSMDAGLAVRALFIIGLYGETEEALKRMLDFIEKNDFMPLVKHLVPFPGTSLYTHAINMGKIKEPVDFLRMLSRRKVGDFDDEIINLTELDESVLRDYFHRIWKITKEREGRFQDEA